MRGLELFNHQNYLGSIMVIGFLMETILWHTFTSILENLRSWYSVFKIDLHFFRQSGHSFSINAKIVSMGPGTEKLCMSKFGQICVKKIHKYYFQNFSQGDNLICLTLWVLELFNHLKYLGLITARIFDKGNIIAIYLMRFLEIRDFDIFLNV